MSLHLVILVAGGAALLGLLVAFGLAAAILWCAILVRDLVGLRPVGAYGRPRRPARRHARPGEVTR